MIITSTSTLISIGLYDNSSTTSPYSGTRIATTTFSTGQPVAIPFDIAFSNGLSVVSQGTAVNYVISYQ
jgi:hypothetical protein